MQIAITACYHTAITACKCVKRTDASNVIEAEQYEKYSIWTSHKTFGGCVLMHLISCWLLQRMWLWNVSNFIQKRTQLKVN